MPPADRIIRIHEMLDPQGTSLKSIEELVAELQRDRRNAAEQLAAAVSLIEEIAQSVGARANGQDARAMAQKARDWLAANRT